jgi:hypothetical protein
MRMEPRTADMESYTHDTAAMACGSFLRVGCSSDANLASPFQYPDLFLEHVTLCFDG